MSKEFGNDIISISDEDGNDYVLEHIDTIELDNEYYLLFLPADMDKNHINYGYLMLKAAGDNDLEIIKSKQLQNKLYDMFMQRLFEDEE